MTQARQFRHGSFDPFAHPCSYVGDIEVDPCLFHEMPKNEASNSGMRVMRVVRVASRNDRYIHAQRQASAKLSTSRTDSTTAVLPRPRGPTRSAEPLLPRVMQPSRRLLICRRPCAVTIMGATLVHQSMRGFLGMCECRTDLHARCGAGGRGNL